jgi:hypothetical protein
MGKEQILNVLRSSPIVVEPLRQLIFEYASLTDEEKFISMISPGEFSFKVTNPRLILSQDSLDHGLVSTTVCFSDSSLFAVTHPLVEIVKFLNHREFCDNHTHRLFWNNYFSEYGLVELQLAWESVYKHWQNVRAQN